MGSGTQSGTGAQPAFDYDVVEIWRLHSNKRSRKDGGTQKKKFHWKCVYPPPKPGKKTRRRDHCKKAADPKDDWEFTKKYRKAYRESADDDDNAGGPPGKKKTRHFNTYDFAVVFRSKDAKGKPKRPIVCHVPKAELGYTGTIYQKQELWTRILNRAHLKNWDVPTEKEARDRDLVVRPYHLKIVDGDKKDVLLTSLSPQNIEQAKSFMRGEVQFEYKFIDPNGMEDSLIAETVWQIEPKAGMPMPDADEVRETQERRELLYEKIFQTRSIVETDGAWYEDTDKWNEFNTLWGSFLGEAEPSPVAGSTTLQAVIAFVSGIFKAHGSADADGINTWSGGMQSVHEGLGIGFNVVAHCYAIHRIMKEGDTKDPRLKKHTADLVLALGKGYPAAVSSIDVIGQGILASGQNGAELAQQFADKMAPAATFAAFLGSALSAAAARSYRRAGKSFNRRTKFDGVISSIGQNGAISVDRPQDIEILPHLQAYSSKKLTRRENRMVATGWSASVSSVSGLALGIGLAVGGVAAANFWNPLGWILGGMAVTAGLVIGGYMLFRRIKRSSRHKERRAQNKIGSSGEFANELIDFFLKHNSRDDDLYRYAVNAVVAYHVPLIEDPNHKGRLILKRGRENAIERIKTHFN